MTARVVIFSTLTARPDYTPRRHAESPECPGVPICGTNLRNWTRAVAVDDCRLCAACWGDVSNAENAWDSGRIADKKRPDRERANVSTGPNHNDLTRPGAS